MKKWIYGNFVHLTYTLLAKINWHLVYNQAADSILKLLTFCLKL